MSTAEPVGGENRSVGPEDWANTPRASGHAEFRWLQRSGVFSLSLIEAWIESYPVGLASHRGKARLHPPTRKLLTARDGVITTVLDAERHQYTASHLLQCQECELEFQPRNGDRHCPWCGYNPLNEERE